MSIANKKFPTFSLITVTLNNYAGLQKTFQSVDKQNFTDFEWIVIDGGSTDESVEFLRKQRSKTRQNEHPFTFTSAADDGIYDAMNIGIAQARGHYVLFLNAGDQLASADILERLAPKTDGAPDFIYGDSLEPRSAATVPELKPARSHNDIAWGMFTHHQAMLYRRHTLRNLKLRYSLRYKIASDYDFTARFLSPSTKIVYEPVPICIFEPGGISQKNAFLGRKEQYLIREQLNMVPQSMNFLILSVQSLSYLLRSLSPGLYRLIKSMFMRKNVT